MHEIPQEILDQAAAEEANLAAEIQRLDEQAKRDPAGYKRKVAALAVLGYCYIFVVSVALLALSVMFIVFLACWHVLVLLKFAWLFLIAVGLILKSLWVKQTPPEGLELHRRDVPKLFSLIDKVQRAAGVSTIHKVLLDDSYNCAIVQLPRLGMFGLHENYLLLGLPMLDSLTEEEFTAVLAHEMGHLSSMHGRFGCWVYQVRMSWFQIYVALEQHTQGGSWPIRRFANWFIPLFDKLTLAMRREHEFAADKLSADMLGPEVTARALVRTAICGEYQSREFWPNIRKQERFSEQPPQDIFDQLGNALRNSIPQDKLLSYIKADWKKHDGLDSHPALYERVSAMLPDYDWMQPESALAFVQPSVPSVASAPAASAKLLGNQNVFYHKHFNQKWAAAAAPVWRHNHAEALEDQRKFAELDEKFNSAQILDEEVVELAALAPAVIEGDAVIAYEQRILERFPKVAVAHVAIGMQYLERESDQCIPHFEKATELSMQYNVLANACIAAYMRQQRRDADARLYEKRAESAQEYLTTISARYADLNNDDKFVPHELTESRVQRIADILHSDNRIKKAWVITRKLPEILGNTQNVIVLELKSVGDANLAAALNETLRCAEFNGMIAAIWGKLPQSVSDACRSIPNAVVYDRKLESKKPEANERARKIAAERNFAVPQLSFFQRYKAPLVTWGVIIAIVGTISLLPKPKSLESSYEQTRYETSQSQSEPDVVRDQEQQPETETGRFMQSLQSKINERWKPPHLKHSASTVVGFKVSRAGKASNIRVIKSSGNKELDDSGLEAIKAAAPFGRLPEEVTQDPADIEFTLDYNARYR
jgi:TonB family protein